MLELDSTEVTSPDKASLSVMHLDISMDELQNCHKNHFQKAKNMIIMQYNMNTFVTHEFKSLKPVKC